MGNGSPFTTSPPPPLVRTDINQHFVLLNISNCGCGLCQNMVKLTVSFRAQEGLEIQRTCVRCTTVYLCKREQTKIRVVESTPICNSDELIQQTSVKILQFSQIQPIYLSTRYRTQGKTHIAFPSRLKTRERDKL